MNSGCLRLAALLWLVTGPFAQAATVGQGEPGRIAVPAEPATLPGVRLEGDVLVVDAGMDAPPTARVDKAAAGKAITNPQALSGAWFNPAQDGHGFEFTFSEIAGVIYVAATWYVYQNGQQVYLTGAGTLSGNRVAIDLFRTSGASFPPAFRAADVARSFWGQLQLDVVSCASIDVSWFPAVSGFGSGALNVVPALVVGGSCSVTGGGDDHGGSCASATPVSANGQVDGSINPGTDEDFFRFTLGSRSTFTAFSSNTSSLDPIATLYNGGCVGISTDDDGGDGLNFRFDETLDAGTYYIGVRSFNGNSSGNYRLNLSSSATGGGSATVTVSVSNRLVYPILVRVNGNVIGQVQGQGSASESVTVSGGLTLDYELVRPTTDTGVAVGDTISGLFETVSNPSGTISYTVDNVVGSDFYFSPRVSNQTSTRLLMGANMGLQSENRCNCVVPGNAQNVGLGYYRMFSNSNVRGYREGSGYTGPYIYWGVDSSGTTTPIPDIAQAESGLVLLNATSSP